MRGLLEEVVIYDSPVYANLGRHLRGAPAADYLDGVGDVIARSSRLAEPVLGPLVRYVAGRVEPRRVLDVGCGAGAYLHHVLAAVPMAIGVGIDLDAGAVDAAQANLVTELAAGRCELHVMGLDAAAGGKLGKFDLVLLLNNIYYWSPEERPVILRRLRSLVPGGHVVVASAIANRVPLNRSLDLVMRVTQGTWRLPTKKELTDGLRQAGYVDIDLVEPVPGIGLIAAFGRNPDRVAGL
jgi:SAM-dependent methyltransferase